MKDVNSVDDAFSFKSKKTPAECITECVDLLLVDEMKSLSDEIVKGLTFKDLLVALTSARIELAIRDLTAEEQEAMDFILDDNEAGLYPPELKVIK